jgi:hypothetical protein
MNTISDSLIEKLEELYPKPKAEVAIVKEEPVVGKPWVPDYTITTGGSISGGNYANGGYAIQSTNFTDLSLSSPIIILDQMKVKETSYSYEMTLKQYFDNKMIDFEYKIKDHIRQEIDKLKCSLSKPI